MLEFKESLKKGFISELEDNFEKLASAPITKLDKDNIEKFAETIIDMTLNGVDITLTKEAGALTGIGEGFSKSLGGAGALALMGAGLYAVSKIVGKIGNSMDRTSYLEALEKAIKMNPVLKTANRDKLLSYGETIFRYSPSVAKDPNLLSTLLANAVHGDGMDPMTIKHIVELEEKHGRNVNQDLRTFK